MSLTRPARLTILAIAGLLLLGLAWNGLSQGVAQLPASHTPGQLAQTVTEFAFGIFAALSAVTIFRARRRHALMVAGLSVSLTLAGGLATVVWGGASPVVGVLAGAAALLLALGLRWLLRIGARGLGGA